MEAEAVMLDNLHNILHRDESESLLRTMEELGNLRDSVNWARQMLVAVEDGDTIYGISNLVALVYQADDLLDKILTFINGARFDNQAIQQNADQGTNLRGALKKVVNASSRVTHEVSLFFSSRNQLVLHLVLARQLNRASLQIIDLARQTLKVLNTIDVPPTEISFPNSFQIVEDNVIGRDRDREEIIEKMFQQPKKLCRSNVSVIPIVGLPGVGKSTLAKYVYNSGHVKNHFDLRMWINVSHVSDEAGIIREIVESFARRKSKPAHNLDFRAKHDGRLPFGDFLKCQSIGTSATPPNYNSRRNETNINERRFQREIEGKLYLLILDDASLLQWQHLKDLLASGAKGSQVLVTTRSETVSDRSKTENVDAYHLKGLAQKDSYSLFKRFAFGPERPEEPDIMEIGFLIARECKGVPFTIKIAASLLYLKSENEWASFKDELMEHENTSEHVLNRCYVDLPDRLKACFSYCSLFPDDFTYNRHDLISLWNAQGFTEPQHGRCSEKTAVKYFLELSRRGFFEDVNTDDLGNILTCKMHPIMHRLACQRTAGAVVNLYKLDSGINNCTVLESACCKHISFSCQRASSINIAPALLQVQSLRTLLSVTEPERYTKLHKSVCNVLVSNFKCLRVLDLNDLGIEELPLSVGELIHLRFLDLSKNDELSDLPKPITKLYNLQTLKLNSCPKLRKLPCNFRKLVNLTRLEVDECDSLTCMPLGLEKLTQLETLSRFVVSKDCSKDMASIGLKALKELNSLRGRLSIELTGDWATDKAEAPLAELRSKKNLEELKISWAKTDSESSDCEQLLEVLELLQPNSKLKGLRIEGYKGEYFPSWVNMDMLTFLPNLVIVSIEGCDKCEYLPPFGELEHLQQLTLRHMTNVRYVERESEDDDEENDQKFFPALKELILHNFYKLEGWKSEAMVTSGRKKIQSFPKLTKLRIWNCPKLRSMPLFMEVEDLDLHGVNQMLLEESAKKASHEIRCDFKIKQLQIKQCRNLKSFKAVREGLGGLERLKKLVVEKCDALCTLVSDLKDLRLLKRLEISGCKEINLSDEGSSDTSYSSTTSWMSSMILHPFNRVSSNPWKLLERLQHLTLREIPKMETLPEWLYHVQGLKSLWISACPALNALPEWINQLTALQHLRIESCQSLKRLPDGLQEVKSLIKVEITECPKLMERCKEHTGEDWHKIKHAQVLLHKSWRYGLMSELEASQSTSNVRALTDIKYVIVPVPVTEPVD